jgi:dienelactone hydrolase
MAATRPSTASPLAFLLLPLLLLMLLAPARGEAPEPDVRLLREIAAGDSAAASSRFSPVMQEHLPASRLEQVWSTIGASLGALIEIEPVTDARQDGLRVRTLRMRFEEGALDAQVTTDDDGQVHGLYFRPVATSAAPPAPAGVREVELESGAPGWPLPALLTLPEGDGPFPAVVLVHGSGPQDRDLTIGANKPFRDLAHGLAAHGIASLRYHKRTFVHAGRMGVESPTLTLQEEVIDDVLAALAQLGDIEGVDPSRRFVLGLSLGALVAPRIARDAPALAGIIMLAPSARPLHEIIPAQVRYIAGLDGEVSDAEAERIRQAEALRDAVQRVLDGGDEDLAWTGAPAEYWRDLAAYDALATAAALELPILLLQGERDYQVTVADDFVRWQAALAAHPRAELRVLPRLNHLFIAGEGPGSPAEYMRAGTVDAEAIDLIAGWILGRETPER